MIIVRRAVDSSMILNGGLDRDAEPGALSLVHHS